MLAPAGSVLGVDVGCSPARKSGSVCRLDWLSDEVAWSFARFRAVEPERTDTIVRVAGAARLTAAAFDGPMRQGLDIIGRYRAAERMLTRRLQPLIGKPGQSSAPIGKLLNEHANACARIVIDHCDLASAEQDIRIHDKAVAEAFPSAFMGLLIDDPAALNARRGDRSDTFYMHLVSSGGIERLLRHFLPKRSLRNPLTMVTNHDDRAALVCAFTALCVAAGDYTAVGDEDGWIVLPPAALQPVWARALLQQNANEERTGSLRYEGFAPTA
ncbi:hypothetical protein AFCDBAGC_5040 [Methylobacterium cerastii]|uniref:DUF429 domain-containing protein n=1 Tax=Methylobacterium cerastii TaxID=932741 RepID=A0ABQ4QQ61_9HYPH|nr:hypothetical protein AFCDBAGC_5040 [Methylobacterium cerastii]